MPSYTLDQALQLAIQHQQAGRLAEAQDIYRQILAQQPQHPWALHYLGLAMAQSGRLEEGIALMRRALDLRPMEMALGVNFSRLLVQAGRAKEAVPILEQTLIHFPNDVNLHFEMALVFQSADEFGRARQKYEQVLHHHPGHADAHNNLGVILKMHGRLAEALDHFQKALQINRSAEVLGNLASVAREMKNHAQSIAWYREALALKPDNAQLHVGLGSTLEQAGELDQAIASYRRAIQLQPAFADAYVSLGNALRFTGDVDQAAAAYRRAISIKPDLSAAFNNLGIILDLKAQHDEAIASYRRAMELSPDEPALHSNLLYSLHFHPASTPRSLLQEHLEWNRRHGEPLRRFIMPHNNDRDPGRRLRIGYVSADFWDHAVGRFMRPLLASHDPAAVEIFCYANGGHEDAVMADLRRHADRWRPIGGMPDDKTAALMREDRIDILVDLTMHMCENRLPVFARKPAPVQATYLAYCSTTGLSAMDYRLSDPFLDPPESDLSFYTEKTIRLESYWCYAASPEAGPVNPLPARQNGRITFGCFNNFAKASPQALETWGQILARIPGSRLLLHANPGDHRARALEIVQKAGASAFQLEFVDLASFADYFQRYHLVDICLDPFPYAGGTTTCDALWMGVPVITLAGKTAVGRGGVSILSTLGLQEFIAPSAEGYVSLAAQLAGDLPRLESLRANLRTRMQQSRLMDAPHFARTMEHAFRAMWSEWCATPAS